MAQPVTAPRSAGREMEPRRSTAARFVPRGADTTPENSGSEESAARPEPVLPSRRTVLVVDDEPAIRDLIVAVLEDEGYRAVSAGTGNRALELLPLERPDLVVMDVMMPEMDGREAVRRIQATPSHRHIPVVLMSAAHTRQSIDHEIAAFLPKPFDLDHFLATIASVIAGETPPRPVFSQDATRER